MMFSNGDPGTGVTAPVPASMEYTEMLPLVHAVEVLH
jgi:hypothetical protein